ncbi:TraR/DksA family transcriptional regulator [Planosporangium sp. 12N6]|uniref:TraR/DksA family transcriptional regulator n=1 Tax=Planosporangium spinosum TaxID=3402278 RepID=UPI003CF02A37
MTSTVHDPIALLRDTLEAQFDQHTDRLAELTLRGRRHGHSCHGDEPLTQLIASTRQDLADTAHALRRMADGTYGICERCQTRIPRKQLDHLPHARLCGSCQQRPPE